MESAAVKPDPDLGQEISVQPLLDALRKHNARLEALYRVSLEINSQRDLPELLRLVVAQAAELLGAPMGGLYLVRPDGQSLELVVSHNQPSDLTGTVLPFGEGLSGRIAQTGQVRMVEDYHTWVGRAAVYEDHPYRRVLGVPLKIGDRVIGVINVTDTEVAGLFSEDEINLVKLFADQAALAVENARYYDETQRELIESRRSEAALRESENRFRQMIESHTAPMLLIEPQNGEIVDANLAAAQFYGYSREELRCMHIQQINALPDDEIYAERMRAARGEQNYFVFPHRLANGSLRTVEVYSSIVDFGDRKLLFSIIHDITERQRAEEQLRDSEARWRSLVESAPAVILVIDREGKIVSTNRPVMGLPPAEAVGKDSYALLPETLAPHVRQIHQRVIENGQAERYEAMFPRPDGSYALYDTGVGPLERNGRVEALVIISFDVTERRRAEDAIQSILKGTAEVGQPFFRSLVLELGRALRVRFALVAEINDSRLDLVHTIALNEDGRLAENIEYSLQGTPCSDVLKQSLCYYANDVQALYPQDASLAEMGVESYMGVPLISADGLPLGLLAILHDRPLPDVELSRTLLTIFANRASAELERLRIERNLQRRDAILGAVGFAAEQLMNADSWKSPIQQVLERLGQAAQASRSYLFQNFLGEDELLHSTQLYEWVASGINSQSANPVLFDVVYQATGLGKWEEMLGRGEHIAGLVKEFTPAAQELLKAKGIQSLVVAPVFVGSHWWGFVGLEDCCEERHWLESEIDALRTAADVLGAAIQRDEVRRALERRLAQLALLNEVGQAVTAALDPQDVLERAARLTQERFGYHHVGVFLLDDDWLTMRARSGRYSGLFPQQHRRKIGEGMVGWAAQSHQTILANDVALDPHYVNSFPDWMPTLSELSVPVHLGNELLGVLDLQSPERNAFDHNDVLVMETLADQAAVALGNARLYQAAQEELQARLLAEEQRQGHERFLTLLNEITQASLVEQDESRLLQLSSDCLCQIASADVCYITLWDEERQVAIPRVSSGADLENFPWMPAPVGEVTLSSSALLAGQTLVVEDIYDSAYISPKIAEKFPRGSCALAIPLVTGEQRLGGVVFGFGYPHTFTEIEIRRCEQAVAHVALALYKLRLYEVTRRRADELQILAQVSAALRQAESRSQIVNAILDHLVELFGCQAASLAFYDPQEHEIIFEKSVGKWSSLSGRRLSADKCISGQVVVTQRVYRTTNLGADPSNAVPETSQTIPYAVCVPLITRQAVLGVLWLADARPIDDSQVRLLTAIADITANTFRRQSLYEDLQVQLEMLHRTQARLVQSEKLAAIGELVSGVAHELNNPLSSVVLFAQLLQQHPLDADAQHDLGLIISEALRAARIVRGLLDFSRQRPVERKPAQINDLLTHCLDLVSYELRTHRIRWTLDLAPDLPVTLVDAHQMQQVFVNLINNAWQAINAERDEGSIRIATCLASPAFPGEYRGAPNVIQIMIQDDGPGIPAEHLSRIFDPFFTTKPEGKGTGLGLSVCHGIVTEHGGNIWVESEPGKGCTFLIELPVAALEGQAGAVQAGQAASASAQLENGQPAPRILLIDDETILLNVMARSLRRAGYHVDTASGGKQALERLDQASYNLVLCDMRMPDMSGIDFFQRVKSRDPELAQHILFTTGDSGSQNALHFLEQTGASYITKPFELSDLIERVNKIVG